MSVLIFGASGQDGFYLKRKLLELGEGEVFSVSRSSGDYLGDVSDYDFVNGLIEKIKPKYIFHLAATSSVKHEYLFSNHNSISTGSLNVLESVKRLGLDCRIFLSGSAMQFKNEGKPINEMTAFDASSPYSISRIHSVYAARYYREHFNMKVYVGYFFNHDSALRSEKHINQMIINTAKEIKNGSTAKLLIGDLEAQKEFNYAGDVIDAVWLLVNQDRVFESVIGSGIAYSIKDWIEAVFNYFNLDWKLYVEKNDSFVSPYGVLVSDPGLIKSLGWSPSVDFNNLVLKMVKGEL